jgi:hypothetical protein
MEGLLDFVLRDILTRVGGVERCVSEFIRITDSLLPERVLAAPDAGAVARQQNRQRGAGTAATAGL